MSRFKRHPDIHSDYLHSHCLSTVDPSSASRTSSSYTPQRHPHPEDSIKIAHRNHSSKGANYSIMTVRSFLRRLSFASPNSPLFFAFIFLIFFVTGTPESSALKCLDCIGKNCMGSFCEGDYCVLSHYAPRWGTVEWGEPRVVKGCISGTMVRKDVRSHCETADEEGNDVFTCFCNNKDYCNGDKAVDRLEVEPVQLLTCVCEGSHCKSPTCLGELCSYVVNHKTKKTEQGCVNASVPIVERRSAGACMIPPITGAMHHTVASNAEDLLTTESCVCGTDYCNMEKPEPNVEETMNCQAFVKAEFMGTKMASKEVSCTGQYCFKAKIKSKIGNMAEYNTIGCASFADDSELAEELNPTGCAKFESENVKVEACMQTTDRRAIGRARANQQGPPARTPKGRQNYRSKGNPRMKPKPKMEVEEIEDQTTENEREEEDTGPKKPSEKGKEAKEWDEESEDRRPAKEGKEGEKESEAEGSESEGGDRRRGLTSNTEVHYIFERPTLAPEIEESSNTALVSVFLLIILLIVLSGVVWKLQLHKRLFRASYDTVAGG